MLLSRCPAQLSLHAVSLIGSHRTHQPVLVTANIFVVLDFVLVPDHSLNGHKAALHAGQVPLVSESQISRKAIGTDLHTVCALFFVHLLAHLIIAEAHAKAVHLHEKLTKLI